MEHRKWEPGSLYAQAMRDIANEHNATVDALEVERDRANDLLKDKQFAEAECTRLSAELAELKQPIRVPFTDEQIEKMARACAGVFNSSGDWYENCTPVVQNAWHDAIRAAVAAGGLEPCPVPTSPALHPGETVEGVVMERDHYRVQLEREQEWVKQYKADRDDALAELAQVKAERSTWRVGHDLANERVAVLESELAAVKAERDEIELRRDAIDKQLLIHRGAYDALDAKLAALRQRESVPVKVRFDVTAAQASKEMREKFDVHCHVAGLQIQMDYLAAHAVIDVPAGVPEVKALREIGINAYLMHEQAKRENAGCIVGPMEAAATAIRDRVLAGAAAERMALTETGKPVQWTPAPTDAQIEALARVMEESVRYTVGKRTFESKTWAHIARAAFAHIGAVPSVDPDAWKTPLEIRDSTSGWVKTEFPNKASILLGTESSGVCLTPSDAAQLAAHLASYAAAHGCPVALPASETPKGLPSIDDIAALIWESDGPHGCNYNPATCEHTRKAAEIAFTALAPYLRDPVGWELDVHPDQLELYKWVTEPDGGYAYAAQQALNLCRSRIRPTFECKECAKKDAELRRHNDKWTGFIQRCQADAQNARAALEGE